MQNDLYDRAIFNYASEIAFTDQEIDRLVGTLEVLGLAENTLVIVTADHGEGFMEHGYPLHGLSIYQEEVHVPLVMRLPGTIPSGSRFEGPVELMDLAPTALSLLGIDIKNEHFDGRNLAPVVRGLEPLDPEHPVIFYRRHYPPDIYSGIHVSGELFGVLRESMKLIDHSDQVSDEFYDLDLDPDEDRNLFAGQPEEMATLRIILDEWKRRFNVSGAPQVQEQPLSDSNRRALEALGYVEPGPEKN